VEKVVGDALMSDWSGSFEESKDNAYKACQTALQLRSVSRTIARNKAYWPFPNHPLHLDLALTTGPVAAGALLYDENNPALWGDTANVAFRIEALIPEDSPGEIVVDGTTYNLTNQYFNYESMGNFTVRGRQREVAVYKLIDYIRNK
jgi:class 3 adenylate cyclase